MKELRRADALPSLTTVFGRISTPLHKTENAPERGSVSRSGLLYFGMLRLIEAALREQY